MDSLGRKIARAREKMDWTQDELALRSRVPRRTIQNIEYDRVSPRLDNLLAMARTLNIRLDELVGEEAYAKTRVATSMVNQYWIPIDWTAVIELVGKAGLVRRLAALYVLAQDKSEKAKYLDQLKGLPNSSPIVQYLLKAPLTE